MTSLFSTKPTPNTAYAHVWHRVNEVNGAKERIDRMWKEMQPYVDSNFASEYRLHPYARSWELILGSELLRQGFQLESKPSQGPDFKVVDSNRFIWVEATTPSSGIAGPDAIPVPPSKAMFDYPERQIILRIRGAIEEKLKQFQAFAEDQNNPVGPNDCFVLAINGMKFHFIVDSQTSPAILKAVLPIGAPQIQINRKTNEIREGYMEYRPKLLKDSGSSVATTCFLDPAYANISTVLFSVANFLMNSEWLNRSTIVVHNPLATNPLPHSWLGFGNEIIPTIDTDTISWAITRLDTKQ